VTDDELRATGQAFISRSREYIENGLVPPGRVYSPTEKVKALAYWDFIDPLRMGIYLKVAGKDGCFAIDSDHIAHVCTNPSAFKQPPARNSARIGEMDEAEAPIPLPFMSAQDEADHLESGEPLYLDGQLRAPSADAKASLELLRSIPDDLVVESYSPAADTGSWFDNVFDDITLF
jgi:hypothetical protein